MLFLSKWQNVIDKMVSEMVDFFLYLCLLSNSPKNLYQAHILSAVSKIILTTVMCDVMQNVKHAESITVLPQSTKKQ